MRGFCAKKCCCSPLCQIHASIPKYYIHYIENRDNNSILNNIFYIPTPTPQTNTLN